jgi:PAS domain S-box-containing protein
MTRRDVNPMTGTIFEASPEPAFLMDPARDCIVAANAAGCELLEYDLEEIIGLSVHQVHPPEYVELRELLDRVLEEGRASTIRLTCRTKLGRFLPTEISLHALELDGELRVLGLVQDRSEHRPGKRPGS